MYTSEPQWERERKLPNHREALTIMDAHFAGGVYICHRYSRIREVVRVVGPQESQVIRASPEDGQHPFQLLQEDTMAATWAFVYPWPPSYGASQLTKTLIGVPMKTRIRQFYHVESDQVLGIRLPTHH